MCFISEEELSNIIFQSLTEEIENSINESVILPVENRIITESKNLAQSTAVPGEREFIVSGVSAIAPQKLQKFRSDASSNAKKKFDKLSQKFVDDFIQAVDWYKKKTVSKTFFFDHAKKFLRQYYHDAFELGLQSTGIQKFAHSRPSQRSATDKRQIDSAWKHELKFFNKFLEDILVDRANRRFTLEQRVEMYGKALSNMYNTGRLAATPENVLLHWVRNARSQTCASCWFLVTNSPYTKDTLPTTPRGGLTICLSNCNCRIIAKTVDFDTYRKRRVKLRSKDWYYRRLLEIKKIRPKPTTAQIAQWKRASTNPRERDYRTITSIG